MLGLFDPSNATEVGSAIRSVRCEDSSVLVRLLADLKALPLPLSAPTPYPSHSQYMCGGSQWSVGMCRWASSLFELRLPFVCVNCSSFVSGYCDLGNSDRSKLWSSSSTSLASLERPGFSISCSDPSGDLVGRCWSMLCFEFEFDERSLSPAFVGLEVADATAEVSATINASYSLAGGLHLWL
jgi:hypothetical protein